MMKTTPRNLLIVATILDRTDMIVNVIWEMGSH